MPTVIVEGPKLSEERKRNLVERISKVVQEVYGIEHVTVIIHENLPENVGINGCLLSDRVKERKS